jgi:hypothetical protein
VAGVYNSGSAEGLCVITAGKLEIGKCSLRIINSNIISNFTLPQIKALKQTEN